MSLLSILGKGIKAMIDEANTPESFRVGQKFEEYVRKYLFIESYYDLVHKTHDYNTNKDYVLSSLKPDFIFRDKWTKREFYVEAKFRSGHYNNKIPWCNERQLARYQEYNREMPVFVILGIGGDPNRPMFLSLIPLSQARYTDLFTSYIRKFDIEVDQPVSSKVLWGR